MRLGRAEGYMWHKRGQTSRGSLCRGPEDVEKKMRQKGNLIRHSENVTISDVLLANLQSTYIGLGHNRVVEHWPRKLTLFNQQHLKKKHNQEKLYKDKMNPEFCCPQIWWLSQFS